MFEIAEKPTPRAGEQKACFYDGGTLPSSTDEHIFNACWGGSHASSRLVCDGCNAAFSRIDGTFGPYTDWIFNSYSITPPRRSSVPEIDLEGQFKIGAGGRIVLKGSSVEVVPVPESNQQRVTLTLPSKGELRRMLNDGTLEAKLGAPISGDTRAELLRRAKPEPHDVGEQHRGIALQFEHQYRLAAHVALKCLALYKPEQLSNPALEKVREFARHGTGNVNDFALRLEDRTASELAAERQLGTLFNMGEVHWSASLGKVIGYFVLLGKVRRAVVLVDGYTGPSAVLSVIEGVADDRKLRPCYLQYHPRLAQLPLLSVARVTQAQLLEELQYFTRDMMTSEPIYGEVHRSFAQIQAKHPLVTPEALTDVRCALAELVVKGAELAGARPTRNQVEATLEASGLAELRQCHLGAALDSTSVSSLLMGALQRALRDFVPKAAS